MSGFSASAAKKRTVKAPVPRIATLYTVEGRACTFAEVYAMVLERNKDVGESKVHSRLSRGHRTLDLLAADTLPHYKPKLSRR